MKFDLKESLSSSRKPDISHARRVTMVYIARACEYGDAKYERANYLRPTGGEATGHPAPADVIRFRSYLRSALSHIMYTLDGLEHLESQCPGFVGIDSAIMAECCYSEDTDATPGAPVGASYLPHVAHAAAALQMAIVQAVDAFLLPADPERPWEI